MEIGLGIESIGGMVSVGKVQISIFNVIDYVNFGGSKNFGGQYDLSKLY